MFPILAAMKTILTSFQCCWSGPTTMADGDIGAEEPQAGHRKGKGKNERNGKDEEMKLFATLYESTAFSWE